MKREYFGLKYFQQEFNERILGRVLHGFNGLLVLLHNPLPHVFEQSVHEEAQFRLLFIRHLEVQLLQVLRHGLYLVDA